MRQWLIEKREALGLDENQMAARCDCSARLLELLEHKDFITHKHIASRIAHAYGLTLDEYNSLIPERDRAKKIPSPKSAPKKSDYYTVVYAREYRYKHNKR